MTSARPLLLGATVAMDVFCPSLLSYHSDALVAMDQLLITTMTYDPCLIVVVSL
jgi:hypothetical protein